MKNELELLDFSDFKRDFLDIHKIPFVVVGSLALQESGFDVNLHDIDIEAICNEREEKILDVLAKSSGSNFHESYNGEAEKRMEKVTWSHKPYAFKWGSTVINVWVVTEFSHEFFVNKDGIKIAKPISVLKKKMTYRRSKDYQTLNKIIQQIVKLGE